MSGVFAGSARKSLRRIASRSNAFLHPTIGERQLGFEFNFFVFVVDNQGKFERFARETGRSDPFELHN